MNAVQDMTSRSALDRRSALARHKRESSVFGWASRVARSGPQDSDGVALNADDPAPGIFMDAPVPKSRGDQ